MRNLTAILRFVPCLDHVSDAAENPAHRHASLPLSRCFPVLAGTALWAATVPGLCADYAGWAVGNDAGGNGAIIHTFDSGATWERQGAGLFAGLDLDAVIAVDTRTAWVVGAAANGYSSIYRTTDAGMSWTRMGSAADLPNAALHKINMPDARNIWAVGDGAIVHSSDGGASWVNQTPAGYASAMFQGVFSPDGVNVWATGDKLNGYATVLKSTDAGLSWTRQSNGFDPDVGHILGVDGVDASNAWAVGGPDGNVLRTVDGGSSWELVKNAEPKHDANELSVISPDTIWVACDSMITWTSDGGKTWDTHNTADFTMDLSVVDQTNVWAVSQGIAAHIYHTSDGGANWEQQTVAGGWVPRDLRSVSFASDAVPEPGGVALMAVVTAAGLGVAMRRKVPVK